MNDSTSVTLRGCHVEKIRHGEKYLPGGGSPVRGTEWY